MHADVFRPAILLLALPLFACVGQDVGHCANRAGDKTCAELGAGAYCSACEGEANGCVAVKPSALFTCYTPGDDPFVAGTSTGELTDGGSTGPECTMQGLDDSCPADQPYCIEQACTSCDDHNETFCADLDPAAPVCAAGLCVSCTSDPSVCGGSAWCNTSTFACAGCSEHEQCPDSACEVETGECMPSDTLLYVDNAVCPPKGEDQRVGSGTKADPFCRLNSAVDEVPAEGKATVFVQGGGDFYENGIFFESPALRTIAFIGIDEPRIGGVWPGLRIQTTNKAYLHGLYLRVGDQGIRCRENSKVWGSDLTITSNVVGIEAEECTLDLWRCSIRRSHEDGISLTKGSFMRMRACGIRGNGAQLAGTSAIHTQSSGYDIRYSTIVGNRMLAVKGDQPLASMQCQGNGGFDSIIRNSIVVGEELDSIVCPWPEFQTSVVDTSDLKGDGNVVLDSYESNWWRNPDDASLSTTNPTPFGGVGIWAIGDPAFDKDGPVTRSPGDMTYVGADQL